MYLKIWQAYRRMCELYQWEQTVEGAKAYQEQVMSGQRELWAS